MTDSVPAPHQVELPQGQSASTLFRDLLADAVAQFAGAFEGLDVPPNPAAFKKQMAPFLIGFEQRRQASSRSAEIAAHVVEQAHRKIGWAGQPLKDLSPSPGLEIDDSSGASEQPTPSSTPGEREPTSGDRQAPTPGWAPEVEYDGQRLSGAGLRDLVDGLVARHHISPATADTLRRALDRVDAGGGRLNLSGHRFALLGAGAEIAPTQALLSAGATVLWCDIHPPPDALRNLPGRLLHAQGRGDLLTAPDKILHAVGEFARVQGPTHLGLFAYAPGKGREWRLGAAMNAVARALPPDALQSVGLYISPTSPAMPEDAVASASRTRWTSRAGWQRLLTGTGVLRANRSMANEPWIADTIVPIQGVSYQAAQYIEKTLAMEAFSVWRPNVRISAPVAPVTKTRSIEHPVFAAAFRGTRIFQVEAFPPGVTLTLCALIYLENLLGEPSSHPMHFHGGLFTLPFALEGAIRVAAAKGFVTI